MKKLYKTGKEQITYQKRLIEKKIEKNDFAIALSILYIKEEKIYPAYVSKNPSNCEEQVTYLMIPYGEGWHYLAVKKIISIIKNNIKD